jgi:hypothetical protein
LDVSTHHQILQSEDGVLEGLACPGDHLLRIFENAFLRGWCEGEGFGEIGSGRGEDIE